MSVMRFADATVVGDPNALLTALREVLISAAIPAVGTSASLQQKDAGVLPQVQSDGRAAPVSEAAQTERGQWDTD